MDKEVDPTDGLVGKVPHVTASAQLQARLGAGGRGATSLQPSLTQIRSQEELLLLLHQTGGGRLERVRKAGLGSGSSHINN